MTDIVYFPKLFLLLPLHSLWRYWAYWGSSIPHLNKNSLKWYLVQLVKTKSSKSFFLTTLEHSIFRKGLLQPNYFKNAKKKSTAANFRPVPSLCASIARIRVTFSCKTHNYFLLTCGRKTFFWRCRPRITEHNTKRHITYCVLMF